MTVLQRAEALVFKTALALPQPIKRLAAGRALVRQGQTLATDNQLALRLMRIAREPSLESLPIPEAREQLRRQTWMSGGDQPIGAVRDLPVGDRNGRLYVPTGATSPGPLLVFFHGGGFIYGDLDTHDPACRFLAEHSGVRVLSVDYRLAPEHTFPTAHDDCVASYRWVVEHAESLGADPARLAVGGDSAGGALAATTALAAAREGLPMAFQLLIYPMTDMRGGSDSRTAFNRRLILTQGFMDLAQESYLNSEADVTDPRASALLNDVPDGLAQAYVVTAGFDPLRDEGEAYARTLADAGVQIELRRFPEHLHGFIHFVGIGRAGRASMLEIAGRVRAALV
ncbi:MAG: alpha/beta hydrolase [Nocardioides sp.]